MAKEVVYVVLRGQSRVNGQLRNTDFVMLEGVCAPGVSVEDIEKGLQAGNLKAIAVTAKPGTEKAKAGKDEGGA